MKSFISKTATFLLAPIILSASCLSCLIQATPVYAATSTSAEIQINNQGKDCESYKKTTEESVTDVMTSQSVALMTSVLHTADRGVHANHGTDCGHAYSQTKFEIKTFQPANFRPIALGIFNNEQSPSDYNNRFYLDPPNVLIKNKNFLTGTTIKKE